jgi:hypothetical protein
MRISPAIAACLLAAALPALAKETTPDRRAAAFQAVLDCRSFSEAGARLACYDAAAAKMDEAESHGDIVVIDRAKAAEVHRQAFGLPVPSLDFVTKALKPGEVDRIEGVVSGLRADASGRWTFSLEDGAMWRQIDGDLLRPPRVGSKVSIYHGVLGSFLMNVDGQPAVKVHRDR